MVAAAITPYLDFSGKCDEALEFYKKAIGAQVEAVMRFNESPEPAPPGMLQAGFEKKVMHSHFRVNGISIMATDGCNDQSRFDGFSLALSVHTEAEADRFFNALADGGKVEMPLSKTFWSPRFGMVADRFGVRWMVMVCSPEQTP